MNEIRGTHCFLSEWQKDPTKREKTCPNLLQLSRQLPVQFSEWFQAVGELGEDPNMGTEGFCAADLICSLKKNSHAKMPAGSSLSIS